MSALAHWCFRRWWAVVAVWFAALVIVSGVAHAAGSHYTMRFQLGATQSAQALKLLQREFPAASGASDQIVFTARPGGPVAPLAAEATAVLQRVSALPDVRSVTSPFTPAGARQVSPDGTVAYATVTFAGAGVQAPRDAVLAVVHAAEAGRSPTLGVELSGNDVQEATQQPGGGASTGIGVLCALIVLGIAFGALFATPLPIICALFSIGIGVELTALISHVMSVASFGTILDALIGLGVGVDYALFIVTRYRANLKAGATPEDAVAGSVDTAGRAVFFAGLTVCIALLGQFVLGLPFLYGIAVSASITVLLTMLASLTLLPALLRVIGMRALSRRQRRMLAVEGPHDEALSGAWYRWARSVERRPLAPAVVATIVVVVLALPVLTLRLGLDDAGTDPPGSTTLLAYQELAHGFGPGSSGPLQLVASLAAPGSTGGFERALTVVRGEPGVAAVSPVIVAPSGRVALAQVIPSSSPQSAATTALVHHLRAVLPAVVAGTGTTVLVGGPTAIQIDFAHVLSGKILWFIVVVVALGFVLLMAVFRSVVVPVIASIVNLLSVGAALGVMNAVFEWGWGRQLFRIPERAPIEVFIPVMILSILFGLSMDYEVFLVSRMHEEWVRRRDNTLAVTLGQAATGRVITAAATIMVLVFVSFALGDNVVVKQFGIGLAAAILLDAFVVRTVVVPAVMQMIGPRNWWLPAWLDRALPHLHVEGASVGAVPPAAPAPVEV